MNTLQTLKQLLFDFRAKNLKIFRLHEEIIDFCDWMTPTNEEQAVRMDAFMRVRDVILELWPNAIVDIFGSFRTGLYLPTRMAYVMSHKNEMEVLKDRQRVDSGKTSVCQMLLSGCINKSSVVRKFSEIFSDIDVVVIGNWQALPLWTLEKALKTNDVADESTIKVLDTASVPIIKLTDKRTEISIDVSFNMNNGVKSAKLILDFMKRYPPLSPLVFVLKQFLLQRNLNEVVTGGISSYCLILMAISFLQQHTSRLLTTRSDSNFGVLLIEFFELYGRHFNYGRVGIRVTHGGAYVPKKDIQKGMADGQQPSMLCIEDPLQPGNDIGRSSYGVMRVRQAFEYASLQLSKLAHFPNRQLLRDGGSYLARIIRVPDEVVKYRLFLRQRFHSLNLETKIIKPIANTQDSQSVSATEAFGSAVSKPPKEKISSRSENEQKSCSQSSTSCTSDLSSDTESDVSVQTVSSRGNGNKKKKKPVFQYPESVWRRDGFRGNFGKDSHACSDELLQPTKTDRIQKS